MADGGSAGMSMTDSDPVKSRAPRTPRAARLLLGAWPDDAGFLGSLRESWTRQYADYLGEATARELVDQLHSSGDLYRHQEQFVLLASLDDTLVGIAAIRSLGKMSLLTMLEVLEPYRQQGIGRQLVEALLDHAERLLVHVSIHRPDARAFYDRLGFQALERTVVDHYGHALEFDVMVK